MKKIASALLGMTEGPGAGGSFLNKREWTHRRLY